MTSRAMLEWTNRTGVDAAPHRTGQAAEDGFVESFDEKLRDQCVKEEVFANLARPAR